MPRQKRTSALLQLPLSAGETWEIGRRPLAGLASQSDDALAASPDLLFVVQAESKNLIYRALVTPDAPPSAWLDHVRQAMLAPDVGKPRRPQAMRVSSAAEARALRTAYAEAGIAVEVAERLAAVDAVYAQAMTLFGHVQRDYRANAEADGDKLSDAALRTLYQAAQQFYRKTLWEAFDDSEIFAISFPDADGRPQTCYGVLMGSMEEEFGLALYASLEDLQRVYTIDVDDVDDFPLAPDEEEDDEEAWEANADLTAQLLSVPGLSLSYAPKRELPPPLAAEAEALKLPVAKSSAYPLMMRTGQGMHLANLADLRQLFIAMHAILAWDKQAEALDLEDELDETLTVEAPAMADAQPALTVEVTLVVNPYADDDNFIDLDDDFVDIDAPRIMISPQRMQELFDPSLLDDLADFDDPSPPARQAPAAKSEYVYTLKVFLTVVPYDMEVDEGEISREILLLGHHTLHDLHLAIFEAFERWEAHLYEFNLGSSPQDQSRLYFYDGGWSEAEDTGDPRSAALDELDLIEGQCFGYTFDMGDEWEHVIEVISVKRGPDQGPYPRLGKQIGVAPPQYPDDEEA